MLVKKCFCSAVLQLQLLSKCMQCLLHAFTPVTGCPTSVYFSIFISILFLLIQPQYRNCLRTNIFFSSLFYINTMRWIN